MMPINPILAMPIQTPRLWLRPPQINDAAALNQAAKASFKELARWMPWSQAVPTLPDTTRFIEASMINWTELRPEEPWLPLMIIEAKSGRLIGATGFHHYDWNIPCAEIGYWLATEYSGQGYMREAINALTQYAFIQLKLKRLEIRCDRQNTRSIRVAEGLNYQLEACLRKSRIIYATGEISDTLIYVRFNLADFEPVAAQW